MRRQGRGTFITDPVGDGLADRFCSLHADDGTPCGGRIDVEGIVQDVADAMEQARMQLDPQDLVWRLRRIRHHGDRAFMCERVALPAKVFPQIRADAPNRIVPLAHRYGLMLGAADERITLGAASVENAETLAIAPGAPVLLLDRVVRTTEGQPVEWRHAECHPGQGHYLARITRDS